MPASRIGGVLKLTILFAIEVAFVVTFHALGSIAKLDVDFAHFSQWLNTTPPETALVASIRILALIVSYWMLGTSVLYMVARAFRIPGLLRTMEFATIPGVRRIIDAGLAATIIGGTVFGGAGAVWAKQANAEKHATPAAVSATYKDLRVLYNPTPASDPSGPQVSLANDGVSADHLVSPVEVTEMESAAPSAESSSTSKVVVSSTQTDASTDIANPNTAPTLATVTASDIPARDNDGHYVPTPAGGGQDTIETSESTSSTSSSSAPTTTDAPNTSDSTTSPKIVVTPSDDTTTTSPKVVVPTTSPAVTVEGTQVERPNDPATGTPTNVDSPSSVTSYTVVKGDNFWAIADAQLRASLGRTPSNTEVANYWVKLIDANRQSIRSGDPDLIFPGEVFSLPPAS